MSTSAVEKDRDWLTKEEVAERFGVTTRTIDNWKVKNGLPYFQVGNGPCKFYPDQIDEWVEKQQHNA